MVFTMPDYRSAMTLGLLLLLGIGVPASLWAYQKASGPQTAKVISVGQMDDADRLDEACTAVVRLEGDLPHYDPDKSDDIMDGVALASEVRSIRSLTCGY